MKRSIRYKRFWPVVWLSIPVAMLLAAGPFAIRGYYLTRLPYVDEPFDTTPYETIDVADEENAYLVYSKAVAILSPDRTTSKDRSAVEKGGWEAASPAIRDHLQKNAAALELWKQAMELPKWLEHQPRDTDFNSIIPEISALQSFARLAELKFFEQHHSGNQAEAWSWIRALLRNGHLLQSTGGYIQSVAGSCFQSIGFNCLHRWSSSPDVDGDMLRLALHTIREIAQARQRPSMVVRREYIAARNSMSESNTMHWYPLLWEPDQGKDGSLKLAFLYLRGEPEYTQNVVRHSFQNVLTYCDRPRWLRPALAGSVFKVEPPHVEQLVGAGRVNSAVGQSLSRGLTPGWEIQTSEVFDRLATEFALAEIVVCLRLYYLDLREFPQSINDLVPDYIPEAPLDPMSLGPQPRALAFRRTEQGAVVYSVGENGLDDGGQIEPASGGPLDTGWTLVTRESSNGSDHHVANHSTLRSQQ